MTASNLKNQLQTGQYQKIFKTLYGNNAQVLSQQYQRYCDAVTAFETHFPAAEDLKLYSAPGRTEIAGNHTDHNHGKVFAASINLDMIAVVSKNNDFCIRAISEGFHDLIEIDLHDLQVQQAEVGTSAALLRGVAAGIVQRGGEIGGFNLYIRSDVLGGSGLSSSAAYEVLIGEILNQEYNQGKFTAIENAKIGQYAETVFFQKPCGLMDQMACAVGGALLIDFADLNQPQVQQISFDLIEYNYALCIVDTKGSHADLTDDYAQIKQEMQAVANFFGKTVLREITLTEILEKINQIRTECGDRAVLRALHFHEECERVNQIKHAIEEKNFSKFLTLVSQAGHSSFEYNQNAYSLQQPSVQGLSIGLAVSQQVLHQNGAWRLHGGGFAGTIQAFIPLDRLHSYQQAMEHVFGSGACYTLQIRPVGAVQLVADYG